MEERTERLLRDPDHVLFRAGGCHVFALTLRELKGWPLVWVHEDGGEYDHVACGSSGDNQLVDFFGWYDHQEFCRVARVDHLAIRFSPVEEATVRSRFILGPGRGYYALPEFFESAARRARAWIEKHDDIFSGRRRAVIGGVSRIQKGSNVEGIFGDESS